MLRDRAAGSTSRVSGWTSRSRCTRASAGTFVRDAGQAEGWSGKLAVQSRQSALAGLTGNFEGTRGWGGNGEKNDATTTDRRGLRTPTAGGSTQRSPGTASTKLRELSRQRKAGRARELPDGRTRQRTVRRARERTVGRTNGTPGVDCTNHRNGSTGPPQQRPAGGPQRPARDVPARREWSVGTDGTISSADGLAVQRAAERTRAPANGRHHGDRPANRRHRAARQRTRRGPAVQPARLRNGETTSTDKPTKRHARATTGQRPASASRRQRTTAPTERRTNGKSDRANGQRGVPGGRHTQIAPPQRNAHQRRAPSGQPSPPRPGETTAAACTAGTAGDPAGKPPRHRHAPSATSRRDTSGQPKQRTGSTASGSGQRKVGPQAAQPAVGIARGSEVCHNRNVVIHLT